MKSACVRVVIAVVLLACPAVSAARQFTLKGPPPPHTETDKKLLAILSVNAGATKIADIVSALEQFIRDNPDYPRLNLAYSNLMNIALGSWSSVREPDKIVQFADEALTKYPKDANLQRGALSAKIKALKAQGRDDVVKALALKALETETDARLLQTFAEADPDDAPNLFEKAIAERRKKPNSTASPWLGDLMWSYSEALIRAGRNDEGLKVARESLDQMAKEFADLQVPKDDVMFERLSSRYRTMATLVADTGNYDKALEYAALAERNGNSLAGTSDYDNVRAAIYAKMGNHDLELESYARSYASSMDPGTRNTIREVAPKYGRKPDDLFARARVIRKENAAPFKAFELKTMDGEAIVLDSLKARAILVNFFFPT